MSKHALAEKLRKFYCEARPKHVEKRGQSMPALYAAEYHRNTHKNIRAAINRHLHDLDIDVDIVRDKEFIHAYRALDGTVKDQTKRGVSRPTAHKAIISTGDLNKISTYLANGSFTSPIVLRQAMWFNISLHFVTRGMEIHHQLLRDSFVIKTDESGDEYATLTQETLQKNFQGGLYGEEAPTDRRMYGVPESPACPVKLLRFYLDRLEPDSSHLFNHCTKQALLSPGTNAIWYMTKPLSKYGFSLT